MSRPLALSIVALLVSGASLGMIGVTVAEAARIQIAQEGEDPPSGEERRRRDRPLDDYRTWAKATTLLQVGTIALNVGPDRAWSERRSHAVVGILAGVAGVALGGHGFHLDRKVSKWAYGTTVISAVGLGLSLGNFIARDALENVEASLRAQPVLYVATNEDRVPQLALRVNF